MIQDSTPRRVGSAAVTVAALVFVVTICVLSFRGDFDRTIAITVTADRAGLILNPGAKVKVQGVEVGKVTSVHQNADGGAELALAINKDYASGIAGNSGAQIAATTVFGSKFVDLTVPAHPLGHLVAGTVIESSNVTTEVNSVFQNLVSVTEAVAPDNLKSAVSALAQGLQGQGAAVATTLTDANAIVTRWNEQMPTFTDDLNGAARVARIYADLGPDLVRLLDTGATSASVIATHASEVDSLLASTVGLGSVGTNVLSQNKNQTLALLHALTPTTALLAKYQDELRCVPGEAVRVYNLMQRFGGGTTGYSLDLDVALLFGDDSYKYPQNLPIVAAKGGPYGRPGCYPSIDATNSPAPYLAFNTGAILNGAGTYSPRLGSSLFTDYLFGNDGKQP